MQKFKKGDEVEVLPENLKSTMVKFRTGRGVISGSYHDFNPTVKNGRPDIIGEECYEIIFNDGHSVSWYPESTITPLGITENSAETRYVTCENEWLKVKKAKDRNFYFTERRGVDSVAFILIDKKENQIGLINETKPPFNERDYPNESGAMSFKTSAFGGSLFDAGYTREEYLALDEDKKIELARETAIKECREEAGYTPIKALYVGKTFNNSMSNEYIYNFVIVVDTDEEQNRDPQTPGEALANVVWTEEETKDSNGLDCIKKMIGDKTGAICGKALTILFLMFMSEETTKDKDFLELIEAGRGNHNE